MKLGKGKNKYKINFIYDLTGKHTYKYVYANTKKEAEKIFYSYYLLLNTTINNIMVV